MPQIRFELDRGKARNLDVPVSTVFETLQVYLGGYYVNDFNRFGKTWRVYVQSDGECRRAPNDMLALKVLNHRGEQVPLSALGEIKTIVGPIDVPALQPVQRRQDHGQPGAGYSSGQAIQAMQEIAAEVLPDGFDYEWTGSTYQELKTGNQATFIFALSIICVFLFMAALYESWIRPMVIILTVPLATFGAIVGLWIFNLPLDVFGQIGLVMLIGLETKNAILVVEFGVELMEKQGHEHHRLRQGSRAAAAAADPHDLVRLHHGRPAHGPRHRGGRLQPQLAGHRHRLGHARSAPSWAGS